MASHRRLKALYAFHPAGTWLILLGMAVLLHDAAGLGLGYLVATAFRLPAAARRSVALEAGMRDSGFGVALATTPFSAMAALSARRYSVIHNLRGSALAGLWRRRSSASGFDG